LLSLVRSVLLGAVRHRCSRVRSLGRVGILHHAVAAVLSCLTRLIDDVPIGGLGADRPYVLPALTAASSLRQSDVALIYILPFRSTSYFLVSTETSRLFIPPSRVIRALESTSFAAPTSSFVSSALDRIVRLPCNATLPYHPRIVSAFHRTGFDEIG